MKEDTKARSLATYKCRGGNAANALVVCSQLGGRCHWLSTSTDPEKDNDAAFIHADLAAFNVDCSLVVIEKEGSMPVSYILASRATGSRTIVHSRTVAELSCEAFERQVEQYLTENRQHPNAPVWFHFEGRNMETVRKMMVHVRERAPYAKISVEIEFPRYPWTLAKTLASLADYVFMSKDYLRDNNNISSAYEFFEGILTQRWGEDWNQWTKAFICPWGSKGVYYLEMADSTVHHIPAAQLDRVVESNGAGDTFIGATIACLSRGSALLHLVLKTACDVATVKCSQHGFKLPTDKILTWQRNLQEREDSTVLNAEGLSIDGPQTCKMKGDSANTSNVPQMTHSVTSEVELELQRVQHHNDNCSVLLFAVPLLPILEEDDDGDVVVPRRHATKRMKSSKLISTDEASSTARSDKGIQPQSSQQGTGTTFILEAHSRSTWDTAGTQLWRAAFLLAEYIYNASDIFSGQTVLELGCGIGFTSIVASQMSDCVYATDSDNNALLVAQRNAERNCSGDLRLRLLDWEDNNLISTSTCTSTSLFTWTSTDVTKLEDVTIIIASDVFYDDITTTQFLIALRRLMLQHNRATSYVSAERRSVFSAVAMKVVSLGYDTFQDHVCLHDPSTCHTYVAENQIRCQVCATDFGTDDGNLLQFVVREISIDTFPQRFKYDRLSSLMLWKISAVVVR
ncbi:hypothetical protein V7S43_000397 [Phytophthora oleae]|uniref:Ig-like domain-containing protein n=1 Tax=Phytophthora oleae TaxID=2107226 RepID=A0ABD3G5K4_9STRA